ncbi:helix-turn-helix transcriptional regulator [[Leptolyngbya] sp. PCC 7376]|uniref:helix-turn-helix domain-containing protein n=1 Tax=[Leptolyngbya] sp. PCC 7376 TaxID=111781 RepID=UPI001CEC50BE
MARQKFDASGLTQEKLAEEIDIQSRDTISKFFNQKSISRTNFVVICKVLQISLEEVMQTESSVATGKAGQAKSKQKKIQTVAEDICPYVWLEAFTQDTAQFFKGRDVFV